MSPAIDTKPRRWLRRRQASAHIEEKYNIPCAEATLATMAVRGGGPPYSRVGNTALYAEDNLDEWALEKLSTPRRSTSEERQHAAREPSCDPHLLTREPARSG
jgi:hypothetical protein